MKTQQNVFDGDIDDLEYLKQASIAIAAAYCVQFSNDQSITAKGAASFAWDVAQALLDKKKEVVGK